MAGRTEVNPGEWFMVADRTILVQEYESILGDVAKLGGPSRPAYLLTFTGKVNNRDEQDSVTVAMDPMDAWHLVGNILAGLELLKQAKSGGQ